MDVLARAGHADADTRDGPTGLGVDDPSLEPQPRPDGDAQIAARLSFPHPNAGQSARATVQGGHQHVVATGLEPTHLERASRAVYRPARPLLHAADVATFGEVRALCGDHV